MADRAVRPAPQRRQGVGAPLFAGGVVSLVALALLDARGWWFITALLLVVAGAVIFFHFTFPGTRFFAIALANSLAAYASIFAVFVEVNFAQVGTAALVIGFALPIVAFCAAAEWQRQRIGSIIAAERSSRDPHLGKALLWLLPVFGIGALTFALPDLGLGPPALGIVLLVAMAAIAAIVLLVGPSVAAFLIDTGLLFEAFFEQASRALPAVFAFLTFYSMLVIVFAALYRILGLVSPMPDFVIGGHPRDISFSESLYFSVITMATVGYGDITPLSALARLVAAIQVVVGILLLLFGFSEIIAYARRRGGGDAG